MAGAGSRSALDAHAKAKLAMDVSAAVRLSADAWSRLLCNVVASRQKTHETALRVTVFQVVVLKDCRSIVAQWWFVSSRVKGIGR